MSEKFLLIDGSSLLHRAFFALPPLTNKAGVRSVQHAAEAAPGDPAQIHAGGIR